MPGRPLHPRRAKSGSPSEDNLFEPRCSAQHSPLPHRGPPGLSPFTVAPVNRTPAGLPEPRVGRIRRLQPSDLHPKSHYHPSARRAVRSPPTPSSAAAHRSRSSRRRLVLDGSSAVRLPGDIADAHVGVQHVGADDHRTGVDLEDNLHQPVIRIRVLEHASVTGTTRGRLAAPAGGAKRSVAARDDDEEERRSVVRQRFIGDLQTVVAAEGPRSCTCPWLAQVAS